MYIKYTFQSKNIMYIHYRSKIWGQDFFEKINEAFYSSKNPEKNCITVSTKNIKQHNCL